MSSEVIVESISLSILCFSPPSVCPSLLLFTLEWLQLQAAASTGCGSDLKWFILGMQRADTLKHILPPQPCIPPIRTKKAWMLSSSKTVNIQNMYWLSPLKGPALKMLPVWVWLTVKCGFLLFQNDFFSCVTAHHQTLFTLACQVPTPSLRRPVSMFVNVGPPLGTDPPFTTPDWLSELWCLISCENCAVNPALLGHRHSCVSICSPLAPLGLSLSILPPLFDGLKAEIWITCKQCNSRGKNVEMERGKVNKREWMSQEKTLPSPLAHNN